MFSNAFPPSLDGLEREEQISGTVRMWLLKYDVDPVDVGTGPGGFKP